MQNFYCKSVISGEEWHHLDGKSNTWNNLRYLWPYYDHHPGFLISCDNSPAPTAEPGLEGPEDCMVWKSLFMRRNTKTLHKMRSGATGFSEHGAPGRLALARVYTIFSTQLPCSLPIPCGPSLASSSIFFLPLPAEYFSLNEPKGHSAPVHQKKNLAEAWTFPLIGTTLHSQMRFSPLYASTGLVSFSLSSKTERN